MLHRREFLAGFSAFAGALVSDGVLARDDNEGLRYAREIEKAVRSIGFDGSTLYLEREFTGQPLLARFRYGAGGPVYERGYAELSWFFRDLKDENKAVFMDIGLFDILATVQAGMSYVHGSPLLMVLTSGYRTPGHNANIEGAARNSLHIEARAADVKVRGYSSRAVAIAGSVFADGGIGVYPSFTHLDVGNSRCWSRWRDCGGVSG